MSTYQIANPSTGQIEKTYPSLSTAELDASIDLAHAAFLTWKSTTLETRAAILAKTADLYEENADELADIIGREMGKRLADAKGEVQISADIYRWYAENGPAHLQDTVLPRQGALKSFVEHRPLGALLGVMPWNFPYYQVARFAAPNLLIGNTILLKHASICPLSNLKCQEMLEAAGLPQGGYQALFANASDIERVIADFRVKGVSLTGSEAAGISVAVAAAKNIKKSVLELGGNDPMVLLDTANVDALAEYVVGERLYNAGQVCTSNKRVIVLADFYDEFIAACEKHIKAVNIGAYDAADTELQPLSSIAARDEVVARIAQAAKDGANVRCGGEALDKPGAYMTPALITDIPEGTDLSCNELFGPALMVYKVADEAAAIALANASVFGLSASVFSTDLQRADKVAKQLNAGMVNINEHAPSLPGLPFGGISNSGYGRELAEWGLHEFTNDCLRRISPQNF